MDQYILTPYLQEVLQEMRGGKYLVKNSDAEGLSFNEGNSRRINTTLKGGTIHQLQQLQFVYESANPGKFLLTNTGRSVCLIID